MQKTRTTNQRLKILEHLRNIRTHPNAEAVFKSVRKDLPVISLATVYRNLNMLASQGTILKLEINGEYKFDANTCGHQHAVCTNCGKIIDIFEPAITTYALKKLTLNGFKSGCVDIIFKGRCDKC
ncbi:transcriptional repressor [Candidatus Woesearchaeota archaeon]|nr:transcriptional repressor [Candidatus Woesearchaeota archaeon]